MGRMTQTNGNSRNGICGCRITFTADDGTRIDRFTVPSMFGGANYCTKHPTGAYGRRYFEALRAMWAHDAAAPDVSEAMAANVRSGDALPTP